MLKKNGLSKRKKKSNSVTTNGILENYGELELSIFERFSKYDRSLYINRYCNRLCTSGGERIYKSPSAFLFEKNLMPFNEIARRLGISLTEAQSLYKSGMEKIKKYIAENDKTLRDFDL